MALALAETVRDQLETDRFGRSLRGVETVGSTNTAAAEWARNGAPDGSVLVTEYQSAGRGRHGRTWTAKKGQNLMFSVVLRPALEADRLGLVTVAASVAVAEAIDPFVAPHRAALKWPNDVLLEGRKTCGMLLESSISGRQEAEVVVLGVGLNVNQVTFPDALADTATSLRLVAGRAVPRAPLFARLLRRLEIRVDAVQSDDGADDDDIETQDGSDDDSTAEEGDEADSVADGNSDGADASSAENPGEPTAEPAALSFGDTSIEWSLFGGFLAAFTNYLVQTRLRDQLPVMSFDRSERRDRLKPVVLREFVVGVGALFATLLLTSVLSGAGITGTERVLASVFFSGALGSVTGYRRFPYLGLDLLSPEPQRSE